MALFHLSVTQTKRSAGQSAIASAAYRAGERLYSEYYGEYSDYTRKGGVICSDILIDRDDEGEDTVHFLNQVDEADLMALMEDGSTEAAPPAVCSCTDKCEAGKVNVSCPVCKDNMTACSGKEAEPETEKPTEQPKEKGNTGGLVLFLVVALLGGGGAFYYFKFMKPKQNVKGDTDLEDFDFDDYDEDEGDGLSDEEQEDEEA